MRTLGLVGCVKRKRDGQHPARDLYTSPLFRLATAYLDDHADDWYVLSAKYGLVHKDHQIACYDVTLNAMPAANLRSWAERVWVDLEPKLAEFDEVLMLAGEKYRRHLVPRVEASGTPCKIPLRGMPIGRQLSWLKRNTHA